MTRIFDLLHLRLNYAVDLLYYRYKLGTRSVPYHCNLYTDP